jgi:hypothetical protein
MSPRQYVVVENKALRRFAQRYGYCLSPAMLARKVEALLRLAGDKLTEEEATLYSGQLTVYLKRRGDQWFITWIDRRQ